MKIQLLRVALLTLLTLPVLAQTRPNPDAPSQPPPRQDDGPMRVLDAPPRQSDGPRQDQPPSWKDRLRLGGSFALTLGTFTNIEVAPAAGLQLTDRLAVGGSVVYRYISSRASTGQRFTDNSYGGRAFAFYNIFENINLNAELETLNVSYFDVSGPVVKRRTNLNSFLAGGSYSQPLNGRFVRSMSIMVLYNFNFNQHVNPTLPIENIYPSASPLVIRFLLF
ncbi:MAG: hypothetical protein EAZ32_17915 [Cytophagia bacterium]|nr:MAG: hypothetical protein EAZ46_10650 [Runella sp.]TAG17194.1 MAG: hypothetical protein EAZ38_17760 [Cytophagales bacterium]TAG35777.1 MAG: hypothetical protein EAZ32_17915 [Cytophagia bacterium]TAG51179.1 MAG: hypothetical protein EAZ29_10450 [Runella slithyformis]TAG65634.1 MAG: hypothetical protein EAZ26_10295 [Runella slithyformis]